MANADLIHPGLAVREHCLERFGLSVTDGAKALGVSRQALTNLLSGKTAISPEMAIRLDHVFGGSAETWLQRQVLYDLAQARLKMPELNTTPVVPEIQRALF